MFQRKYLFWKINNSNDFKSDKTQLNSIVIDGGQEDKVCLLFIFQFQQKVSGPSTLPIVLWVTSHICSELTVIFAYC